jgi:hypothetical protein
MKTVLFSTVAGAILGLGLIAASNAAHAGVIPYPNSGTPNAVTYTFTAAGTGHVIAYFGGSGASFDELVGMLDITTGTDSGTGLNDHASAVGASFDMGLVNAGDTLVFYDVISGEGTVYSVPSMNVAYDTNGSDGHNHIYSTSATAGQIDASIPAGTYVGF